MHTNETQWHWFIIQGKSAAEDEHNLTQLYDKISQKHKTKSLWQTNIKDVTKYFDYKTFADVLGMQVAIVTKVIQLAGLSDLRAPPLTTAM